LQVIRADEGSISEHDKEHRSIVLHEPGVVGEIIPWNFNVNVSLKK
jgi:aldehyde dehydrogenase (NAD+)/aldehyde dehydrogenase